VSNIAQNATGFSAKLPQKWTASPRGAETGTGHRSAACPNFETFLPSPKTERCFDRTRRLSGFPLLLYLSRSFSGQFFLLLEEICDFGGVDLRVGLS
jgi:hypothetical protein